VIRERARCEADILGAQGILDNEGELRATIPEPIKASADDLPPALAAV
jgi:hypothetical protein